MIWRFVKSFLFIVKEALELFVTKSTFIFIISPP